LGIIRKFIGREDWIGIRLSHMIFHC
jgi:hypothetical protein